MTELSILASGIVAPTRLNPVQLFLDADIVVQVVMAGLLLASIWTWTLIVSFSLRLARASSSSAAFEDRFLDAVDPQAMLDKRGNRGSIAARVASAGLAELKRSTAKANYDALPRGIGIIGVVDQVPDQFNALFV